ncbi:uncharacterized protein LOC141580469 [Saimiri boliviensis]|uniref:uncharacterized protein LOC141580469 n=1 Tax=Saimiri boliviensis TaxID=27679 RepID=UPI003D779ED3
MPAKGNTGRGLAARRISRSGHPRSSRRGAGRRVRRSLRDRVGEGPSAGGGLKSGKGPREEIVSPLTGSARRLVRRPTQVDGELIRPWATSAGRRRGRGNEWESSRQPRSRAQPGRTGYPQAGDRTGCLVRRRATFPPQVRGIPRGPRNGTGRRENRSHYPEFVPNPSQSRGMEQTVGNSQFKGGRLLCPPPPRLPGSPSPRAAHLPSRSDAPAQHFPPPLWSHMRIKPSTPRIPLPGACARGWRFFPLPGPARGAVTGIKPGSDLQKLDELNLVSY